MEASVSRVPVKGSVRAPLPGARPVGPADPNERISVSVYVRPARPLDPAEAAEGKHLSREEFVQTFGADPDELAEVQSFATAHGLTIDEVDAARRVVVVSGPVAAMQDAFAVKLANYEHDHGSYRGREGAVTVVGGTSAVAPLWAGLVARINSARHAPSGLINTALYANPTALHDITSGTNGAYHAAQGWDPCTGLGTPDGKLVEAALAPPAAANPSPASTGYEH